MPGILSGRAVVEAESSQLCGADVAFRKAICCDGRGRLDALVGYRFLSFDDAVRVFEDLHPTVAPFPPDSRIGVADGFAATNRFHGLLLGLGGEYPLDGWFVAGRLAASVVVGPSGRRPWPGRRRSPSRRRPRWPCRADCSRVEQQRPCFDE